MWRKIHKIDNMSRDQLEVRLKQLVQEHQIVIGGEVEVVKDEMVEDVIEEDVEEEDDVEVEDVEEDTEEETNLLEESDSSAQ